MAELSADVAWNYVYCQGWNRDLQRFVGLLDSDTACARNKAGEQYSVTLLRGGVPRVVIDIAWSAHYLGVWTLDEALRRDSHVDYRRLRAEQLFPVRERVWRYAEGQRDGDDDVWEQEVSRKANGWMSTSKRPRGRLGGSSRTAGQEDDTDIWREVPAFGDWRWALPDEEAGPVGTAAEHTGEYEAVSAGSPWRPPTPYRNLYLDDLMLEGATVLMEGAQPRVVAHRLRGMVDMPTGQVITCELRWLDYSEPFTDTIEPGRYEVHDVLLTDPDSESDWWPRAGFLLRVSEAPVVSWEMALRAGEDPRTLSDGDFYGFSGSQGCFVDAEPLRTADHQINPDRGREQSYALRKWARMAKRGELHEHPHSQWSDALERGLDDRDGIRLPGTNFNMIAYNCYYPDGRYPTWIGRATDGATVCFLTDMRTTHPVIATDH
ncbi:DUF4241 domain-containing protein [Nocardia sp. NBC_01730]|uniref:DUF4241 domain-containing protein n=1 Tax=Nocardia sp. NBC_01730 TaxID=2975998 RepID=UPI002E1182FD|nr:DUF4241 domain-containing protein [Nocardia sp. NBC_01730]